MNTHMRKLAIAITTLIFSVASFSSANAQVFEPDDGGFGSDWDTAQTIEGMTWEEWGDSCGTTWECNWAWDNPEVMEQMLASPGFGSGFTVWTSTLSVRGGDLGIECENVSVGLSGASNCDVFFTGGFSGTLTQHDMQEIFDSLIGLGPWNIFSYWDTPDSPCAVSGNEVRLSCVLVGEGDGRTYYVELGQ